MIIKANKLRFFLNFLFFYEFNSIYFELNWKSFILSLVDMVDDVTQMKSSTAW